MMKKRVGASLITTALFLMVFSGISGVQGGKVVVSATQTSSSELRKQKEEAQNKANELRAAKEKLKGELGELGTDLEKISAAVSDLEDDIQENKDQIRETKEELEEATRQKAQQYQSMKLRIRYMYENRQTGTMITLLQSEDFADFLNRVAYVSELSGYDRDKLKTYEGTVLTIKTSKAKLEEEQAALEKKQEKLTEKQAQLNASIEKTRTRLDSTAEKEAAQKEAISKLTDKIAAMERYEKELEARKAREAAEAQARAEAERKRREALQKAKNESSSGNNNSSANQSSSGNGNSSETSKKKPSNQGATEHSAGDMDLLSAIIYCEAGGSSYDCQLAVGSVIMNRIASSGFPNTLAGVIYQSGQFSPASSGRLAVVLANNLASSASRKAAEAVMSGTRTGSWLSFRLNTGSVKGDVIGSEVFY